MHNMFVPILDHNSYIHPLQITKQSAINLKAGGGGVRWSPSSLTTNNNFNLYVCGSGQLVPVASHPNVMSVCGGGYMNPYQFLEFTTGYTSVTTKNLYMSPYCSMLLNHITVTCNVISLLLHYVVILRLSTNVLCIYVYVMCL